MKPSARYMAFFIAISAFILISTCVYVSLCAVRQIIVKVYG